MRNSISICTDGMVYFLDTLTWFVVLRDESTFIATSDCVLSYPVKSADVFTTIALRPEGEGEDVATKLIHLTL